MPNVCPFDKGQTTAVCFMRLSVIKQGAVFCVRFPKTARRMDMKRNKKAFTLIELLVVVLIIGILSAIALPKYQVAVEKTYATQVLLILQSIMKAEDIYYISEGKFPNNYDILDIEIPGTLNALNRYVFSNGAFVGKPASSGMVSGGTGRGLQLYCTPANYTPTTDYQPNHCYCKGHDNITNTVCKSLGGKIIGSGGCSDTGDAMDTTIRSCTNYELP